MLEDEKDQAEQLVVSTTESSRSKKRLDRAAVENLLQRREAIRHAHPGQVFEDSSELLHQMREERMKELEQ
jgi:hypothetical protein